MLLGWGSVWWVQRTWLSASPPREKEIESVRSKTLSHKPETTETVQSSGQLKWRFVSNKHFVQVILTRFWPKKMHSTIECRRARFDSWVRKIPWRREWQPTAVFLPGKFHGQRSLAGYSPWGHKSRTRLSDSTTTAATICGDLELGVVHLLHHSPVFSIQYSKTFISSVWYQVNGDISAKWHHYF